MQRELKQRIVSGEKVILYGKDNSGFEVEGYIIGKEYEVDEVRILPHFGVLIYLKGNVHPYPIESFIKK